jgi:large subunit ribosomal protein L30
MAAYLVVRIRGTVNIPHWARTTLTNLNLDKKFRATIVPENSQTLGMLRKVKDIVAWSSVDAGFITELIEKKGRKIGYKPINVSDLPKEYNSINDLAAAIAENRILMTKIKDFKPWFALSPPKGGFKRKTKTQYSQKGILGENHELPELVKTML